MPPVSARPYDVVIWGTTGVVGRLVAEHITRDYQASHELVALSSELRMYRQQTSNTSHLEKAIYA